MTLGVFVEGESDKQTIPVLVRKIGYSRRIRPVVVQQGDMLDFTEMSHQIEALLTVQSYVTRILVFIDSEGVNPAQTLRRTTNVSVQLNRLTGTVPVSYIVVDHSLEGWLACDADALKAVLGKNAKIRIRGNPENHPRPAQLMERLFRANGREFKKTVHNRQIAEHVTSQNIAEKSPTFT